MENRETIYIGYANQKGGCGKSTLTHLHAKALAIDYDKKVLIIECDKQKSLQNQLELKKESESAFIPPYEVFNTEILNVGDVAKDMFGKYDFVFIDMPGTLDIDGIIGMLYNADILIIPVKASNYDLDSSLKFIEMAQKVKDYKSKNTIPFEYSILINEFDHQLKESKELINIIEELKLPAFETKIKKSVFYARHQGEFNSPQKDSNIRFNYGNFIDEFNSKLDLYIEKLNTLNQ